MMPGSSVISTNMSQKLATERNDTGRVSVLNVYQMLKKPMSVFKGKNREKKK